MALRKCSDQREMWGPSPDLALPTNHPARALDEIIEKLGLDRCNRKYEHTPGEAAYDARAMIKILIYSYMRGITSSREMACQCQENIAFQYLTRGYCPNFRTIALFRRKKRHLVRWVFQKTVALAQQMGIARLGLVALDSVKFPANANAGRKMTEGQLNEHLRKLDEFLETVEKSDSQQDDRYGETRGDELPAEIATAQKRKEKLQKALAILKQKQELAKEQPPKDVSITDPEAPFVKKAGRFVRGYSGQVAADSEQKVIVGVKATADPVDFEQLNPMLEEIEKTTGQAPVQLVADSGYYSDDAVLTAAQSKTDCLVPDQDAAADMNNPKRTEGPKAQFKASKFTYDKQRDEFTCPAGKTLPFFREHKKHEQVKRVYRCTDCSDCAFRQQCTNSNSGTRSIELRSDHSKIRELREKVRTESGKAIYKMRKAIIEPIFGRWQHNWGIRRLRLRGLAGFSVELHLLCAAHNLSKLIRFRTCSVQMAANA